ncbi:DUF6228 family protein [Marilutibacter chinensis]|uniref:DUF6228 family protein n=1 Tax=Marilutibacter chinensis TaxID=2912247 RepID=UPI003CCE10DF
MEDVSFSIRSTSTDKELRFFAPSEYAFSAELRSTELYTVRHIYCPLEPSEFAQFFSRIASYESPWKDSEQCSSLEGDLSISACCSPLGIVTFSISMHRQFGGPEEWCVSSDITAELGQLPSIATAAGRFFSALASV